MKINYLHISDLHLVSCEDTDRLKIFNSDIVTKSMIDKIRELKTKPDFVIMTGDLAHGGQKKEYDAVEIFC